MDYRSLENDCILDDDRVNKLTSFKMDLKNISLALINFVLLIGGKRKTSSQ